MSDAEWLDAFDERLEDVTERWMLARGDALPGAARRARRPLVRRLAHLRNDRARLLGFPDFVALRLHVDRIDRAWYDATMATVEHRTEALWKGRLDPTAGSRCPMRSQTTSGSS